MKNDKTQKTIGSFKRRDFLKGTLIAAGSLLLNNSCSPSYMVSATSPRMEPVKGSDGGYVPQIRDWQRRVQLDIDSQAFEALREKSRYYAENDYYSPAGFALAAASLTKRDFLKKTLGNAAPIAAFGVAGCASFMQPSYVKEAPLKSYFDKYGSWESHVNEFGHDPETILDVRDTIVDFIMYNTDESRDSEKKWSKSGKDHWNTLSETIEDRFLGDCDDVAGGVYETLFHLGFEDNYIMLVNYLGFDHALNLIKNPIKDEWLKTGTTTETVLDMLMMSPEYIYDHNKIFFARTQSY